MSVIEIKNLTKSFGTQQALRGLNLTVQPGEVYGFIGPNGAGKTTTIRILLGMLRQDSGHATLLGGDPWHDAVALHRRLAYVPGDVTFWPDLTGGEVIDLLGRLHGGFDPDRRQQLLARFQLDPTQRCRTYSRGNRQKVALVAAFSATAELLILDEPTAGLDPLMERVFQMCVDETRQAGKTVFLSSHILAEVEAICDRVGIIRQGQIVETGTLAELRHLTRTQITAVTAHPMTGLETMNGIHDLTYDGERWRFAVDADAMPEVIRVLAPLGVTSLTAEPPTLEELFLHHYADVTSTVKAH